jgi:hypothetical protein
MMFPKMIKMYLLLPGLCLGFATSLYAQKSPMKWGEIPPEDLSMTIYAPDTTAEALVLGNYGNLELTVFPDGRQYNFSQHRRVKILKRSGFDKGDVVIPYFNQGEKIFNLQVQVFTPDGKKYTLKDEDIFDEEVNKNISRRRFSAPNLSEGAVLEYRYNRTSNRIFELPEWYFQEDIPTRRSEYELAIPDWLRYAVLTQSLNDTESNLPEQRQASGIVSSITVENALSPNEPNIKRYHYFMEHAVALRKERFITTMKDYYACVRFQLSATVFPKEGLKQVMNTWEKTAKNMLENDGFGLQFLKTRNYKKAGEAVAPLLIGVIDNNKKTDIIYNFLTHSMKWNSRHGFMSRRSLDECFEKKTGHSGELNLLFVALLKENGIPAHPILLSTRSHGSPVELYPIMDQFNHVAVWVEYNDQWIMADIGSPHYALGYPRIESLNRRGFLVRESDPKWVDLPKMNGNTIKLATLKLQEDGSATGTMQYRMQGYDAMFWRDKLVNGDQVALIKKQLTKTNPDIIVEKIEVHGLEDLKEPIELSFEITLPDMATLNGDVFYLNAVLDPMFHDNPFKLEDRKFPVEMPYSISEKYFLQLELPEAYAMEEAIQPIRFLLPNSGGAYQMSLNQVGNQLSLSTEFKVNHLRYDVNGYKNLRQLFDQMLEKQQNPVVLKRKK